MIPQIKLDDPKAEEKARKLDKLMELGIQTHCVGEYIHEVNTALEGVFQYYTEDFQLRIRFIVEA